MGEKLRVNNKLSIDQFFLDPAAEAFVDETLLGLQRVECVRIVGQFVFQTCLQKLDYVGRRVGKERA